MFLFHFNSFREKNQVVLFIYDTCPSYSEMFIGENNIKTFLTSISRVDVSFNFYHLIYLQLMDLA